MHLTGANKNKGFTILELMMVIAIIVILATIVIVSLREAADRGRNTRITTSMMQARNVAEELYLQEPDGYTSFCEGGEWNTTGNETLSRLEQDIVNNGGSDLSCYSSVFNYCTSVRLAGQQDNYFCVDATGASVGGLASNPCENPDSTCQ